MDKDYLNRVFIYKDGVLYNKIYRGSRSPEGSLAGWFDESSGYHRISIDKKLFKRSRAVWIMHNGSIPDDYQIDHINRVKDDDRLDNLRLLTHQENQFNKKGKGYTYCKQACKFKARINVENKEIYLGYFDTEQEARLAYLEAKTEHHIIRGMQ
ncbi:MAG TPA: HNH endonuclease [Flavobacteriales bacterium]|nr:HNH endonuclease [Flavobacteriales bacterium]